MNIKLIWYEFRYYVVDRVVRLIRVPFIILKHEWHILYIRKNEFHKSLDMDIEYMDLLSNKGRAEYLANLVVRRKLAHYNDVKLQQR